MIADRYIGRPNEVKSSETYGFEEEKRTLTTKKFPSTSQQARIKSTHMIRPFINVLCYSYAHFQPSLITTFPHPLNPSTRMAQSVEPRQKLDQAHTLVDRVGCIDAKERKVPTKKCLVRRPRRVCDWYTQEKCLCCG